MDCKNKECKKIYTALPSLKDSLCDDCIESFDKYRSLLKEKNIELEISEDVKEYLLQIGYDVTYGARPLKRTIQKHLVNPLSTELLMNSYSAGDTIIVNYPGDGRLEFSKK